MHITSSYARPTPCHLLRESYWHDGKVKKRTLANLSALPQHAIDLLRLALKNQLPPVAKPASVRPGATRQHGAVSAILGLARQLRLDRMLFSRPRRERSLALALVICRLLKPGAKLRVERELGPAGRTTLAALLDLHDTPVADLYGAMDWLADRQRAIERKLARRHLADGGLALYDVSSSYVEGSCNELALRGYSRDHRRDRPQVVYGLLCNPEGCPVAVRAFRGNTADPSTLAEQAVNLRRRFGLQRMALVGDRGMIAQTRIDQDLKPEGLGWITALRHDTIRKLARKQHIQPGLFDRHDMAAVTAPDFPGERLLVCYNPLVAAERRRKRNALLDSTEGDALALAAAYKAGKYDRDEFNRRLGTLRRRKMGKHFAWSFDEQTEAFSSERKQDKIAAEQQLDGLYVIRTNLKEEQLGDADVVRAYKSLARVERAFRSLKTTVLKVRPIFHWRERRVRAHLFVCMLAYYLEWHMRRRLAPLLFVEEGGPPAAACPVGPAQRSAAAKRKDRTRKTLDGELPLQSFPDLLESLSTLAVVELEHEQLPGHAIPALSAMTELQRRAFQLLQLKPHPAPAALRPPEAKPSHPPTVSDPPNPVERESPNSSSQSAKRQ